MTRKFLIVTALVAGVATTAEAQLCTSNAPFSAGRMRLGVGAEFLQGSKSYGGSLTYGHSSGVYVGGAVSRGDINASPNSSLDYRADVGYQMSFDAAPKLRFCPIGHFGMMKGPNTGTTERSTTHYGAGAAVGGVLSASDNMAIVPSVAVQWTSQSLKTTTGTTSTTVDDSHIAATIAAGFIINRDVTFAPTVWVPLNQDGVEAHFGFNLSYNFGRAGGSGGRRRR
jgi:hypothetical protein